MSQIIEEKWEPTTCKHIFTEVNKDENVCYVKGPMEDVEKCRKYLLEVLKQSGNEGIPEDSQIIELNKV